MITWPGHAFTVVIVAVHVLKYEPQTPDEKSAHPLPDAGVRLTTTTLHWWSPLRVLRRFLVRPSVIVQWSSSYDRVIRGARLIRQRISLSRRAPRGVVYLQHAIHSDNRAVLHVTPYLWVKGNNAERTRRRREEKTGKYAGELF